MKLTNVFNGVKTSVSKHSPEILAAFGIAGLVTSTILAVRTTPKAVMLLEDKKEELETEKLPVGEIVKTTWKCYMPAVMSGAFGIACIIGSQSVHAKRNAAIATAYKLSEKALLEYKEKVIETIGEKKEKTVREKIDKDHLDASPVGKNEVIITEKGNTLCFDALSGRYFKSDIEAIRRAENKLNRQLINEMYVSVNDLYEELGLEYTKIGNDLGWNMDSGLIEIDFSSQIAEDGQPCIVMDYAVAPRYDFSKLS